MWKQIVVLITAAVVISVGINLTILYTAYDNSIDDRIAEAIESIQQNDQPVVPSPGPITTELITDTTNKPTTELPTQTNPTTVQTDPKTETTTTEPITENPPSGPYETHLPGLGSIRGYSDPTHPRTVTFDGIPYAKPPVDNLRFMPPVEGDYPWEGILEANSIPRCLQAFEVGNETEVTGREVQVLNVLRSHMFPV